MVPVARSDGRMQSSSHRHEREDDRYGGVMEYEELRSRAARVWALLVLIGGVACADQRVAGDPSVTEQAPDSFAVAVETTAGSFEMTFYRAWSPAGADRVYQLAQNRFWEGARIYRVNERYAQFGYSGRPGVDSIWVTAGIPDESTQMSNVRGSVSFARGGVGTRSAILFINRRNNSDLDDLDWNGVMGFPPVGRVSKGLDVVDELYAGYGDEPMQWEDSISGVGNDFLERAYPDLDAIISVRLLDDRD